jgi:hypothetical protein
MDRADTVPLRVQAVQGAREGGQGQMHSQFGGPSDEPGSDDDMQDTTITKHHLVFCRSAQAKHLAVDVRRRKKVWGPIQTWRPRMRREYQNF